MIRPETFYLPHDFAGLHSANSGKRRRDQWRKNPSRSTSLGYRRNFPERYRPPTPFGAFSCVPRFDRPSRRPFSEPAQDQFAVPFLSLGEQVAKLAGMARFH